MRWGEGSGRGSGVAESGGKVQQNTGPGHAPSRGLDPKRMGGLNKICFIVVVFYV